jgi:hypothetical protein
VACLGGRLLGAFGGYFCVGHWEEVVRGLGRDAMADGGWEGPARRCVLVM